MTETVMIGTEDVSRTIKRTYVSIAVELLQAYVEEQVSQ